MVIHNFNVPCIRALPAEADTPLVIDANAVLAFALALQGFESIAGRYTQIVEAPGLIQQKEFPSRDPLNLRRQPPRGLIRKQSLGLRVGEAAYHLRQP